MATKQSLKKRVVKFLGGTVYFFWLLQLLWIALLYIQTFFHSPIGKLIKPDAVSIEVSEQSVTSNGFSVPEPVLVGIAAFGGVALIVIAIYVVFRSYIPSAQHIARVSVQKVAEVSADQVVRHHVAPEKKRSIVTARLLFWIKMCISLLPVALVYGLRDSTEYVPRGVAEIVTTVIALGAVLLVLVQHYYMWRWHIRREAEE